MFPQEVFLLFGLILKDKIIKVFMPLPPFYLYTLFDCYSEKKAEFFLPKQTILFEE